MSDKKRIVFIVNPISGTQSKNNILKWIEERLDHSRYEHEVVKTRYAGHATEISAQAVKDGIDIVVAIGGDVQVSRTREQITLPMLRATSGIPMQLRGQHTMASSVALETTSLTRTAISPVSRWQRSSTATPTVTALIHLQELI